MDIREPQSNDHLLLRDYKPRSVLVTEEHLVEKPKFSVTDVHNHHGFRASAFGQDGPTAWMRGYEDSDKVVNIMDQCDIKTMGNLTACWGDDLKRLLDRFEARYQGRFYTFAGVDWSQIDTPGFGDMAATQLEESVKAGARGLKVFKGLGLHPTFAFWRLQTNTLRLGPDSH